MELGRLNDIVVTDLLAEIARWAVLGFLAQGRRGRGPGGPSPSPDFRH